MDGGILPALTACRLPPRKKGPFRLLAARSVLSWEWSRGSRDLPCGTLDLHSQSCTSGRPSRGGFLCPPPVLFRFLDLRRINGERRSLREISQALDAMGYRTSSGKPYAAAAIAKMVGA